MAPVSDPSGASTPTVRTVLGPGVVRSPAGLALDAAGNLFVADAGHCRVLVVAPRPATVDGVHVRPGRATAIAGSSCTGHATLGQPSGLAVEPSGAVYIAEPTAHRVLVIRPQPGGGRAAVSTVAGTGTSGFNGDDHAATASQLEQPTGLALDSAGDLFIADEAACRVRVLPAHSGDLLGQPVFAGQLTTIAGTGVCGTTGQGHALASAELWNPVAVTVDQAGDLFVADAGDQSVLVAAASPAGGTFFGTAVGGGDLAVVVGGTGSYGPYLADGLSATGPVAELNDPRGLAIAISGALYITDGFMHAVRVVPDASATMLGRPMTGGDMYTAAGAIPVSTKAGGGDGTKWVITRLGTPVGVAIDPSGAVFISDANLDVVKAIGP
jgi:hypothetical protein